MVESTQKNKKYHYIKLTVGFTDRLEIQKMVSMPGGHVLFFLYIKLIETSANSDSILVWRGLENSLAKELSLILKEDERQLQALLIFLEANGMLEVLSEERFLLIEAVEMIGSETDVAARMRKIRDKKPVESSEEKKQISTAKILKSTPLSSAERVRLHRQKKQKCNEKNVTCNEDVTNVTQKCNEKNVTCNEDVTNVTLHNTDKTPENRDYNDDRTMCGTVRKCATEKERELEYKRGGNTRMPTHTCEGNSPNKSLSNSKHLCEILQVTEETIEGFIAFRLSGSGIKSRFAVDETVRKNLAKNGDVEQKRFEEWLKLKSNPPRFMQMLVSDFVSFGKLDRKMCDTLAKDFTQMYNFEVTPMMFEMAFIEAMQTCLERRVV
jgi:hypothetical protein